MEPFAGGHRRTQSEVAGLEDAAAGLVQDAPQAPGHVRSISLGSSASQFLQSLKLQDPAALQLGTADQASLPDQHTPHAALNGPEVSDAAMSGKAAATAAAAAQDRGSGQPTRGKRAHRSSNGRSSSDAMQLDEDAAEQQAHGFTPLPAVVEDSIDSERDWDSDSDREGFGPNRRGSRMNGRRGGCNGRSESELMLLDPRRVKRILANRESAARSKERRMNYTMELEGKLHALSVATDKLNSQLSSLNKQESKLRASKADLEHQVESMQQQLVRVQSDNQALMCTLFQLQAAMGLPQALPDCVTAAAGGQYAASAGEQYQQPWQHYQHQQQYQQQYADLKTPTSPKQVKARRQVKQQQQQQQPIKQELPPPLYTWQGSGSFSAAAALPDLSDPAAAAAAPVAELPIMPVSKAQAANGSIAAGGAAGGALIYDAAAAAAAPVLLPADLPAIVPAAAAVNGSGGGLGTAVPQLVANGSTAGTRCALSSLQLSPRQHAWHTGLGSSSSTTPAATPHHHTLLPAAGAVCVAAGSGVPAPAGCTAAAAAAGAGAAGADINAPLAKSTSGITNSSPEMQQLLVELPSPGADAVMVDTDEDIAMLGVFLAEDENALTPAAAAAAATPGTASAAVGPGVEADTAAAAAGAATNAVGWSGSHATSSMLPHRSPQAVGGAAGMPTAGGFLYRASPALSDPVGADFWHEELSSGSVGGSLTHSHTPNLTPNCRGGVGSGANGVSLAFAAAAVGSNWQQQGVGVAGVQTGVMSPQAAASAAGAAAAAAGVSPLTPISNRRHVRTSSGVGSEQHFPAGLSPTYMHHHHQQQQQQPPPGQQTGVSFVMGANPAANWSRGRHTRSASTGCVSGLGWQGYDQFGLPPDSQLHLWQQQQGTGILATLHQQPGGFQQQQQHHHQQQHHQQQQQQDPAALVVGMGLAPLHGQLSMPSVGLAQHAVQSRTVETSLDAGRGSIHRRSHSHAAAFMAQYRASNT